MALKEYKDTNSDDELELKEYKGTNSDDDSELEPDFEINGKKYFIEEIFTIDNKAKDSPNFEKNIAIHDTTFCFIRTQLLTCLYNIAKKNQKRIENGEKIHFFVKYETLEENCTLPNDERPLYTKYLVQVNYL